MPHWSYQKLRKPNLCPHPLLPRISHRPTNTKTARHNHTRTIGIHQSTIRTLTSQALKPNEQAMEAGGATAGVGAEKNSWPEVVGLSSEEAKKKIIEHKPDASVHVVPADSFVTMDYNTGRVRVFVDSNDKVTKAPRIG
ncbi:hypothetical protein ACQJBY_052379 [Aegilops geniculata]